MMRRETQRPIWLKINGISIFSTKEPGYVEGFRDWLEQVKNDLARAQQEHVQAKDNLENILKNETSGYIDIKMARINVDQSEYALEWAEKNLREAETLLRMVQRPPNGLYTKANEN